MSSTDQRVVEMRFDNAQFERGVSQTLSTLDKLKQGLQFNNAISGVGLIQNAIDGIKLGSIEKSVDTINSKFSVLGVVGLETIRKMTDSALDAVTRLTTAIPNQIKSGGWTRALNIENARFQLEGLKVAWDDVSKDLSYAVNGTAYGLDSAAKAAAQLSASGIQASSSIKLTADNVDSMAESLLGVSSKTAKANGDLDDMAISLRAISGVAAMTNSSYDDIANVFIRVAGQGRVMATDLNSLAARGLNAAATLAESMGVTEAELRNMVSKGQIDFQTFSDAMYDAFADHAVEANKTFQGALSNTKAALSKIGAEVADDFLPAATKVLNSVRMLINAAKTSAMPVLNSIGNLVVAIGDTLSKAIDKIREKLELANKTAVNGLAPIKSISDAIDGVAGKITKLGDIIGGTTEQVVKDTKQQSESVVQTAVETEKNLDEIAKAVINGQYKNGEERKRLLQEAGYSFEEVQNKVNEMLGCEKRYEVQAEGTTNAVAEQTEVVTENTEEIKDNTKATKEHVEAINSSTLKNTLDGFVNIGKTIGFVFTTFAGAIKQAATSSQSIELNGLSKSFKNLTSIIIGSTQSMKTARDVIYNNVQGFANIAIAIGKVVGAVLQGIFETITEIKGLNLSGTSESFKDFTESLIISDDAAHGLTQGIKILLTPIKIIAPIVSLAARGFLTFATGLFKATGSVGTFVGRSKTLDKVNGIINSVISGFVNLISTIGKTKGFKDFTKSCKDLGKVIGDILLKAFNKLADKIASLSGIENKKATNAINGLADAFNYVFEALSKLVGGMKKMLTGESRFSGFFKTIGNAALTFGSSITTLGKKAINGVHFSEIFNTLREKASAALSGSDFFSALLGIPTKDTLSYTPDEHLASGIGYEAQSATKALKEEEKPKGLIGLLMTAIENIKNALNDADISSGLKKLGDTIGDFLMSHDWKRMVYDALNFALLISIIRRIWEGASFMKSARGVADSISATFYSISDAIDIFSGKADRKKKSKIKDLAESLLLIVGSIAILAVVNKYGDLPKAIEMLGIILTGLVGVYILIGVLDKKEKLGKNAAKSFGRTILGITSGLAVLTFAISKLSNMSWEDFFDGIKKLGIIMSGMIAAVTIMNAFSKIDVKGGKFIALAVAILALMIPLNILANANDEKMAKYKEAIEYLCGVLVAFGVAVGLMNKLSGDADGATAGSLLAIAIDILAITFAMSKLASIDLEDIKKGMSVICGILITFGMAVKLANADANSSRTFKALALDILALTAAMVILSFIDWQKILVGSLALGGVMSALAGAIRLAGKSKNFAEIAKALALEAVAIGVSLALIATQPWNQILVAALDMSGVMFALAGSLKLAGRSKTSVEIAKAFALEAVAIGVSLTLLATQPWNRILVAGLAMAGVMFAIVGAMKLTKGARNVTEKAMAFAIEALAVGIALTLVATQPWDRVLVAAVAISGVMLALALAMKLISTVNPVSIGVLLSMSVAIIAIAAALMMVASIGSNILPAILGLAAGVLVFVVAVAALGVIADVFPLVIPLLLVLAVAVVAVAAAIYIGALAMEKIVGTILNAIVVLQQLAVGVDQFNTMVNALCIAIIKISASVALAGAILAVVSPLLLIGAVALIAFGAALAIAGAASVVAAVGMDMLTTAVCKGIAKMLTSIGSILELLPKTSDLGKKMKNAANDINSSLLSINTDQSAYRMITGYASGINKGKPKVDSAVGNVTGSVTSEMNKMSDVGAQGGSGLLDAFSGTISGGSLDPNTLTNLLSSGGLSTDSFGQNGSDMGNMFMGSMSSSMLNYDSGANISTVLDNLGLSTGAASAKGTETGETAAQSQVDGYVSTMTTDENKQAAYEGGESIAESAEEGTVAGYNPGDAVISGDNNPLVDFVNKVTSWFSEKSASSGLNDKFSSLGADNSSSYAEGLIDSGSLSDIQVSTKKVNDSTINALDGASSDAKDAGTSIVDNYNTGLKNQQSLQNVSTSATGVGDASVTPLEDTSDSAYKWGQHLGQNFADGMLKNKSKVSQSAKTLAEEVANYLKHTTPDKGPLSNDDVWGIHLGQNLADGMLTMKATVGKAALQLAQNTSDAFLHNDAIDESANTGAYLAASLAYGMLDWLTRVQSASDDLANATNLGVDLIDTDPVIRPVLDLSNVYAGAGRLSNILNGSTMYADLQGEAIARSRSGRLQNESINGSTTNNTTTVTNNITVNAAQGQSVREIADAVSERLNFEYQKKKGCWA